MANLSASWRPASIGHVVRRRGAATPDCGAPWPEPNRLSESSALILANVAPDAALAICAQDDGQWAETLQARIGDKATLTDQSGAYRVLHLQGAAARELLASGIFIDLDPEGFPPGSSVAVRCGHIAVILLHRADGAFEILVPRSFCESFLHWLSASATMRGLPAFKP